MTKNIALYGNSWKKKCKLFSKRELSRILKGKEILNENLNKVINQFCIVLNAQRLKRQSAGLDTRFFDVLCSQGLLITDDPKDLNKHFSNQKELLVYKNTDDLKNLLTKILLSQINSGLITLNGRNKVLTYFSYSNLQSRITDDLYSKINNNMIGRHT